MRVLSGKAAAERVQKIAGRSARYATVEPAVRRIISDVRRNGDRALRKYARMWDKLPARGALRVSSEEIRAAWRAASPDLRRSLRAAAANIRRFCELQKPVEWMRKDSGITLGQLVRPLDSVGCYVPGGRYPLVSTLLMTTIPAKVAGVERIVVVSPNPHRHVLAAAAMLGVREFYRVGGVQAVAALAYGTATIARVDKIVGPGNLYVTAAKKQVAFDCSIDFLAGPTEGMIVSDTGRPEFIAADLVAQAEHDPEALPIFLTTRRESASRVAECVKELSAGNAIAREALRRNGSILVSASRKQSFEWANEIACEHLTVDQADLPLVKNAGSVFIGDYSPQAAGDYASGPNHALPTGGAARFRGGLSVLDFVKLISVQSLSRAGLRQIAPEVVTLANAEGLYAHAQSIRVRCCKTTVFAARKGAAR
jgi:histidinol dehydrogenase